MSEPTVYSYVLFFHLFYFCVFGFSFNLFFVYVHFPKLFFETKVLLIEVTSGVVRILTCELFSVFQGSQKLASGARNRWKARLKGRPAHNRMGRSV